MLKGEKHYAKPEQSTKSREEILHSFKQGGLGVPLGEDDVREIFQQVKGLVTWVAKE